MKGYADAPGVVDLCCGAGGMSLGFKQAGFQILAGVDTDEDALRVHASNFPESEHLSMSIAQLSAETLRSECSLPGDQPVVVCGGPPCQGFSLMGHRDPADSRSEVLIHFARLAASMRPKVIVTENVVGLLKGDARAFLHRFQEEIRGGGYELLDPWVLNARDFGVPQDRTRVFLIAVQPGTSKPQKPGAMNLLRTVWDVLADLHPLDDNMIDENGVYRYEAPDGSWIKLTGCRKPRHSSEVTDRFAATLPGATEAKSRLPRLCPDGRAPTLRAGSLPERGSFMAARPIHPKEPRCITVREAARLHGFPDWFETDSRHWHGFRQIGNSVPPPLARAVASAVRQSISRLK